MMGETNKLAVNIPILGKIIIVAILFSAYRAYENFLPRSKRDGKIGLSVRRSGCAKWQTKLQR